MKTWQIVILPIMLSLLIYSLYLLFHIGFGQISVPDWYEEKPFEAYPVYDFIDYWIDKAYTYAIGTFWVSSGFLFGVYILRKLYKK